MDKKTVIFDLDGTLALIDKQRAISTKDNGKMDWGTFLDPKNINLDEPNIPVITIAQMLNGLDFNIVIFSGRSDVTKWTTRAWLVKHKVPYNKLVMRDKKNHFVPDNRLKHMWLNTLVDKDDVFMVFDDRQQVVDMWRDNGITCFQVADGDF